MARTRKKAPTPPQGFVASAVTLPAASPAEAGKSQSWQTQAWRHFDEVGELRYLATWNGNALSRAQLHAAKREGNEIIPLDKGPAREAMDALYGGPQGQSQMLHLLGVDLTVAGEGYVSAQGGVEWAVLTTGKVKQGRDRKIRVDWGDGKPVDKTASDLIIRVWTPHPTQPLVADAPTRSNLKTLVQIVGYDDHISAQLTSRLAGAGILPLPSEIDFAVPEGSDPAATQASAFMQVLHETMLAAKEDGNSPSAFVPIVVTMPGEYLEMMPDKPISFWSELDKAVIDMRESAIKRFAIGMDAPPEVLMGNSDSNHWNAWLSDDAAIKTHLEPRLSVINHAITTGYLRPALTGLFSEDELEDYYVIADTAAMRLRPDRSSEALELRDAGLLNAEATLREGGFKPEDKMDAEEYRDWLLQRISLGAVTPELTAEALRMLGADIAPVPIAEPQEQPRQALPAPVDDDTLGPPDRNDEGRLAAACEVLVFRALERAGNRLRDTNPAVNGTVNHQAYMKAKGDPEKLLAGAWACATDALDGYDCDVTEVVATLDFYTHGLLSTQRPHSRHTLDLLLRATPRTAVPQE